MQWTTKPMSRIFLTEAHMNITSIQCLSAEINTLPFPSNRPFLEIKKMDSPKKRDKYSRRMGNINKSGR